MPGNELIIRLHTNSLALTHHLVAAINRIVLVKATIQACIARVPLIVAYQECIVTAIGNTLKALVVLLNATLRWKRWQQSN